MMNDLDGVTLFAFSYFGDINRAKREIKKLSVSDIDKLTVQYKIISSKSDDYCTEMGWV